MKADRPDGDDVRYHARAMQLAEQLRSRCYIEPPDEVPRFHVSNENGWTGPCDALSRLGVMEPCAFVPGKPWRPGDAIYIVRVVAHRFATDWNPGEPLHLRRHAGEPSYADLLRALCNHARFDGLTLRDIGIDRPGEEAFIDDLVARGLGSWSPEGGFLFHDRDGGFRQVDHDYWTARLALATELGGEAALLPG